MLGAMLIQRKAQAGFEQLNRRDLPSYLRDWEEEAVFIYPGNISVSGEQHGKAKVEKWWLHFFDHFPSSRFTSRGIYLKRPLSLWPSNELMVHWEVQVANRQGREFRNSGVSFVQVVNGKIIYFKDYIFDLETLVEAWREN